MTKKEYDIQFLLILPDDDFSQKDCWAFFHKTKLETLLQLKSSFAGTLQIISNREYKETADKYPGTAPLHTNVMYIQLPKEARYVSAQEFSAYYVCSQLQELKTVLMALNAETANIDSIHAPISNIHPGANMYMEKMGFFHSMSKSIQINFPCRTTTNTELCLNSSKFFYLEKWKPLIKKRKQGANYDSFVFSFEKFDFFARTFATLDACGIVYHDPAEPDAMELQYDIYYYPDEMIKYEK